MLGQLLAIFESENVRQKQRDEGALSDSQCCPWEWDLTAASFVKSIKLSAGACFIREKAVYVSHYRPCLTWLCSSVCLCFCAWLTPPLPGIAPNITAGPSDSAVIDSMSVILHCETSGAPRPAITWQKGAWANSMRCCGGGFIMPRLALSKQMRAMERIQNMQFLQTSFIASHLLHCFPSCLFSLTFLQYPNLSFSLFPHFFPCLLSHTINHFLPSLQVNVSWRVALSSCLGSPCWSQAAC